jgi:hypothetical protein
VLKTTSELKRVEIIGGWKQLHDTELHTLYSSPDIIRMTTLSRMRWAGHVACMGVKRTACKILVGKTEGEGEKPLRRPRCRWDDIIYMDLRRIRLGGMDWIWTSGGLL